MLQFTCEIQNSRGVGFRRLLETAQGKARIKPSPSGAENRDFSFIFISGGKSEENSFRSNFVETLSGL